MAKKPSHVHKLRKHKYPTGTMIFFCTLPDCYHKIDYMLAFGKQTLCNICGAEFTMDETSLKPQKPHCKDCGKVKVKDVEGKHIFVKKVGNRILAGTATSQNLRSRLDNVVKESEEDI